jgi:hypothetical protein
MGSIEVALLAFFVSMKQKGGSITTACLELA